MTYDRSDFISYSGLETPIVIRFGGNEIGQAVMKSKNVEEFLDDVSNEFIAAEILLAGIYKNLDW